jgi:hypothetical protein
MEGRDEWKEGRKEGMKEGTFTNCGSVVMVEEAFSAMSYLQDGKE